MLDVGLVCGNGYICPAGFTCTSRGTLAFMNSSSSNYNSLELNYGVTGYYDIWHAILQVKNVSYCTVTYAR